MSEKGRIIAGSSGSFLTPPGHPEQRYAVETDLRCRPENRGSMSLSYAAECEWLDEATRSAARKALEYDRPPLDHPAVKEWVNEVLCYFRNCYRGEGDKPWHAGNLIIEERDPVANADDHAGVNLIRRYYPEFEPTAEDFVAGGYGQRAEVVWHADVETPAALQNKIRNSDLVRLSDSTTTIRRVSDVKTPMTAVTYIVHVEGEPERRAYSAEQAAGWALAGTCDAAA